MQRPIRTAVSAAILVMMANTVTNAGSFSLYTESSPAAIGNYAAGIAAEAADASTGWYNPAGLSLLHTREAVAGLVIISPSAKISGFSTFQSTGIPPFIQSFNNLNGAKMGYVPSFHAAIPVSENTAFGISVVAPFGLSTQWNRQGAVRYQATTSNLLTTNVSPEMGSRVSEHLAVGAGIDFQYSHVRLNRVLGAPDSLIAAGAPPNVLDSLSYNRGHSFGLGFHAGLMGLFRDEHTRVGVNYQSQVRHRFNGYSRLQGRLAGVGPVLSPAAIFSTNTDALFWSNDLASNTIIFPEIVTLSAYQDINERLALLGSVVYTGWKSLRTLELDRAAAYSPGLGQVVVNTVLTEDYRNTWRFAVGANYRVKPNFMLRVGTGYDQTPTRNQFRDVRIPDSNRWAASIGAHYQARPDIGIDLGYTHLFEVGHPRVNRTDVVGTSSIYNVNGRIRAYADLVGMQAVWTLDQPVVVATK